MNDITKTNPSPLDEGDERDARLDHVDALLQSWAQARTLPAAQSEQIRAAIVASSADAQLDASWSADFSGWLMGVVQYARTATTAPFQSFASDQNSSGAFLTRGDPATAEFQPYFRLA